MGILSHLTGIATDAAPYGSFGIVVQGLAVGRGEGQMVEDHVEISALNRTSLVSNVSLETRRTSVWRKSM
jgi:hypothetical protein